MRQSAKLRFDESFVIPSMSLRIVTSACFPFIKRALPLAPCRSLHVEIAEHEGSKANDPSYEGIKIVEVKLKVDSTDPDGLIQKVLPRIQELGNRIGLVAVPYEYDNAGKFVPLAAPSLMQSPFVSGDGNEARVIIGILPAPAIMRILFMHAVQASPKVPPVFITQEDVTQFIAPPG